jgi:hypothetical protein
LLFANVATYAKHTADTETNTHALTGIRTRYPSNEAVGDNHDKRDLLSLPYSRINRNFKVIAFANENEQNAQMIFFFFFQFVVPACFGRA